MTRQEMVDLLWHSAERECEPENLGRDGTLSVFGTQAVGMAVVADALHCLAKAQEEAATR